MSRLNSFPVLRFPNRAYILSRSSFRAPTPHLQQRPSFAHQSYGGGEGNPKGENPQAQGSNPSAEQEHPGPPPPAEGQGTGGGPTKAHESGHNLNQNASSGGNNSSGSPNMPKSSSGAQPKILNEGEPTAESPEVKQHNEDMANRHDRPDTHVGAGEKEKVSKEYWSGHGGAGKKP